MECTSPINCAGWTCFKFENMRNNSLSTAPCGPTSTASRCARCHAFHQRMRRASSASFFCALSDLGRGMSLIRCDEEWHLECAGARAFRADPARHRGGVGQALAADHAVMGEHLRRHRGGEVAGAKRCNNAFEECGPPGSTSIVLPAATGLIHEPICVYAGIVSVDFEFGLPPRGARSLRCLLERFASDALHHHGETDEVLVLGLVPAQDRGR